MNGDGAGLRIVVNPDSGPALSPNLAPALREALPAADVIELDGERTCEQILMAEPLPTAVGVSGGDGTVSAVAAIALELGVPMLVVPGGTLNHFARDVGIDSVDDAIEAVRGGVMASVDVAEIDDHVFLNNASLGAYPHVVDVRERWTHRIGKWPALVLALIVVLRRGEPARIHINGRDRRVWLAFFGNCQYDRTGLIAPAGRTRLEDGLIDVRLVHADRKYARLRLVGSAMIRRLEHCSVYEAGAMARVTVRNLDGPPRLAADGEVFDGSGAFEVRKRPSALRVYAKPSNSRK